MKEFTIDGVSSPLPIPADSDLSRLLEAIQKEHARSGALIASVRIDGREIGFDDEDSLGGIPLSRLGTVEITTAPPRQFAAETLETLSQFASHLSELSSRAAGNEGEEIALAARRHLLEGIQTFVDTITTVKALLGAQGLPEVVLLEADLLSILQDLLEAERKEDRLYLMNLFNDHLPRNLKEWRQAGIPALIRSARD